MNYYLLRIDSFLNTVSIIESGKTLSFEYTSATNQQAFSEIQSGDRIVGVNSADNTANIIFAVKSTANSKILLTKLIDIAEGAIIDDSLFSELTDYCFCKITENQYREIYAEMFKKLPSPEENTADNQQSDKIGENIIYYGVPGCGKSTTIKKKCNNENYMERVVFHPDYTYSDFIGQILPDSTNGHISYPFIPGPFTRMMKNAEKDHNNHYYLIIEEINRGNAPAIFGDVFQLLDRKNGVSEFGINNADMAEIIYNDRNHVIRIPRNLSILATMNTADQNVFTLDTAFKRRWKMKSIPNNINECDYANDFICDTDITWATFWYVINDYIIEAAQNSIGSEDKRLGAFFVQQEELHDVDLFSEKVLMYLWNDAFKYDRSIFNPKYRTLEELISGFKSGLKTEKFNVFSISFKKKNSSAEQQTFILEQNNPDEEEV